MSPDPADPIAALQQHLRSALDTQLSELAQQYAATLAEARGRATADAEEAALARIASVKDDYERRLAAETTRLRIEAEQQAAESTARVREELERALAAERHRAEEILAAERQTAESTARVREELERALAAEHRRAEEIVAAERQRLEAESQKAEREAADAAELADARVTERQAALAGFERLLAGIRALDGARSLTEALDALLTHAAHATERAALFLVNGDRLKSWKTVGFPELDAHPFESAITDDALMAAAIRTAGPVPSGDGQFAPTFAAVPDDRIGLAVPIIVGGRAVAVLYADNVGPTAEVPAAWPEAIETLACHASMVLALLTATRTLQALGGATGGVAVATSVADSDEQGARRYARLLVSEIKLYNEGSVRLGREKGDLLARLATEIDRARRMYEERVSPAVATRGLYFQQELVQTLAGGDPGLLGNS